MREHLRLGRILGIPVGLNLSVVVIFALVVGMVATQTLPGAVHGSATVAYWLVGFLVGVLFFASLLAHELAHAVVARHHGVPVERITLWMLGGVAQLSGEPPTPAAEIRIAAAGPLTSLAAGAVFGLSAVLNSAVGGPELLTSGLGWLAGINLLIAVFNVLPGAPLDGGRILRGVLWWRNHDRTRAALAADRAGRALGIIVVGLGAAELLFTTAPVDGLWLLLLGWFLIAAATGEARSTNQHALLAGITVGAPMVRQPVCLPEYQTVDVALARVLADPHTCYPVVSFEGRPVGLVTAHALGRVPAGDRPDHRVAEYSVPLSRVPTAGPGEALPDVLDRAGGRLPVLVIDDELLVGMVTGRDVTRLLQRAALTPAAP